MIKLEQKFLIAYRRKWIDNHIGGFWFKIPDSPCKTQIAKPFDAFGAHNGTTTAYEAKSIKGSAPLKITDLRQSQIDGLTRASKNGWATFVLAYYHDHRAYVSVDFNSLVALESVPCDIDRLIKISI